MRYADLMAIAARALRASMRRTLLSLLGVAIGVAAVLVLTALGDGARGYVHGQFASLGANLIAVLPGKTETSGGLPGFGGTPNDLTLEDALALRRGLPEGAFRLMAAEFDARYPPARRCDPKTGGCWRGRPFPDRAYAFSGDGLFGRPEFSRRVSHIGFSDPVWARLGFINDLNYNWFGGS